MIFLCCLHALDWTLLFYHVFNKLKMHLTRCYLDECDLTYVSSLYLKSKDTQAELFGFSSTTARGSLQV